MQGGPEGIGASLGFPTQDSDQKKVGYERSLLNSYQFQQVEAVKFEHFVAKLQFGGPSR